VITAAADRLVDSRWIDHGDQDLKMIFDNPIDHEYNSRPLATDRILTGKTLMV
jgi:hypothetical protein